MVNRNSNRIHPNENAKDSRHTVIPCVKLLLCGYACLRQLMEAGGWDWILLVGAHHHMLLRMRHSGNVFVLYSTVQK